MFCLIAAVYIDCSRLSIAVGYYGLTFRITQLAGDKYLNFFIGACVEMFAYLLAVVIMKRLVLFLKTIGGYVLFYWNAQIRYENKTVAEMLTTKEHLPVGGLFFNGKIALKCWQKKMYFLVDCFLMVK